MDEDIRRLERAWQASGSVGDEVKLLTAKERSGALTRARLELAAYCGHDAARRALEGTSLERASSLDQLIERTVSSDPQAATRSIALLVLELCAKRLEAYGAAGAAASLDPVRAKLERGESGSRAAVAPPANGPDEAREAAVCAQALLAALEANAAPSELVPLLGRSATWLSNPDALLPVLATTIAGFAVGRRLACPKRLKVRYPMRTQTGNDRTYASDPGGVVLSLAKFRACSLTARLFNREVAAREHLLHGDSRAAVVLAEQPSVVACYTDELDCVVLVRLPPSAPRWPAGERLLTVNRYAQKSRVGVARDLWEGPKAFGRYGNFQPIVADYLTDDLRRLETRKEEIEDTEWELCAALGRALWEARQSPRDGLPWASSTPVGGLALGKPVLHRIARAIQDGASGPDDARAR